MPKKTARKSSIAAIAIPLTVVLCFLIFPSFFHTLKGITIKLVTAPLVVIDAVRDHARSKSALVSENMALKEQVARISLEMERNNDLILENTRLKDLLGFKSGIGYETVSAEVIARDPNNWIGSFTVNKGSSSGLKRGSAVCSAKGLVGKVDEVHTDNALVMLVTHPGFRAGGMLRESRLHGVVEGDGKGHARMSYLPLDSDVKPGEVVVTSGYSREFPKGIVIGKVVFVEKNNTGLFKNAFLRPEADAYDQEEVLCLK